MSENKKLLYRQGFFDAQKSHTAEGVILVPTHLPLSALAIASLSILAALALFVSFGAYTRKARLEGVVMPSTGLVKIAAQIEGRVENLLVAEGQVVPVGAPLYRLSGELYDGRGNASLAALAESIRMQRSMLANQRVQQIGVTATQVAGLVQKQAQLAAELNSAKSALALAIRQADLVQLALAPYEQLAKQGFVSEMAWRQKQIELASAEAKVEELRQAQQRLERDASAAHSDLVRIRFEGESVLDELDRQLKGLEQQQIELAGKEESTVTATVAGTVAAILVQPGQHVGVGDAMLTLVPSNARMQVELYAPSKSIGFLKPGQKVGLRFAAYPYEKFGVQDGRTREISRVALSPNDVMARSPISWSNSEPHYRVIVDLAKPTVTAYSTEEPLKAGMSVSADVDLDQRKIYEWMLEPLWSLRGKI